jgi:hypothetical protein
VRARQLLSQPRQRRPRLRHGRCSHHGAHPRSCAAAAVAAHATACLLSLTAVPRQQQPLHGRAPVAPRPSQPPRRTSPAAAVQLQPLRAATAAAVAAPRQQWLHARSRAPAAPWPPQPPRRTIPSAAVQLQPLRAPRQLLLQPRQ